MDIRKIFPQTVQEVSTLRERLIITAKIQGWTESKITAVFSNVPNVLLDSLAFLDKLTGLWRYEFGIPFNINGRLYWGTHMWIQVAHIFSVLECMSRRLTSEQQKFYLNRLADIEKHLDVLFEMIPAIHTSNEVKMDFEVVGLGSGNTDVDWVLNPLNQRRVLIDVKRRVIDFIFHASAMDESGHLTEPDHEPKLLFKSIEKKFKEMSPDIQLQGAWINTIIKQDISRLVKDFYQLDSKKVHFIILGDWKKDALILTQKNEDRLYLRHLFSLEESERFTFMSIKPD
ncbi:MAG: hypothetical protein Q7S87_05865 [Agitococcus sp.]|nr:hypothetical protein [Agitococcus sp.]